MKEKYIIEENTISELLNSFIEEMLKLGYGECYIGKMIAHIIRALEREGEEVE